MDNIPIPQINLDSNRIRREPSAIDPVEFDQSRAFFLKEYQVDLEKLGHNPDLVKLLVNVSQLGAEEAVNQLLLSVRKTQAFQAYFGD